ncbi:uncharacterized protein C20orf194-like isoform X2 [Stylophora pistillata]|uniref:uncharacterized protein C20orf194-like isoform X2 n=1 Tax=Stylophora pistillata TaxID=50429 RepID=UPI000C03ECD1|nr:uncharacterized protein C20orf194-like isoform X2 [Stylophora pistillata]
MTDFADKIAFLRPVSAKKISRYQLYSPFVSCTRLRKVQELLSCDKNQPPKIDGILCILGIDSRYNGGTKSLLNYLLFGFCKLTPVDFCGSKITEEELEDIVVVVKAESVHVYCNPINYPLLLPYIAHWRNLRIHCLDKELYLDNEEKAEEFKILSFISMVEGCNCLGIPYGVPTPGDQQPCFDPFVLEKWPLIQAFALEGFGSGGFFTMKYKVSDVTQELEQIYGLLDPVSVETLIKETLPLFERHCKSILTNVDAESPTELLKVTESSLSEPIVSYFTHGHIVDRSSDESSLEGSQPFVLLGAHSTRKNMHSCGKNANFNNNTAIGNGGINGTTAKHMVCFAVEPKGRITCARTYFLQTGFVPSSVGNTAKNESVIHSKDLRLLMDLYLLSINVVVEGVKTYSETFNKQKSYSSVLSELKRGLDEKQIAVNSSFLSNNVKFSLEACDYYGRSVDLREDIPLSGFKKATLYLYDIPSVEHPGQILGSVVFGESFLDSAIKILVPDRSPLWDTSLVFLTENILRFVTWQGNCKDRQISEEIESFAKSKPDSDVLGKQLLCGNQIFISSLVNGWEAGSLYIFEQGLVFVHPRVGSIVLQTSKISKLQFYDKDTPCALLILTYHPSSKDSLPYYLTVKQSHVVLALTPRSRIYRQFYSDVSHPWKERQLPNFPQFETIDDLPDDLKEKHVNLQNQLKLSSGSDIQDLSTAEVLLPHLKGFLCHCCVSSSFGNTPVMCDVLPVILGNSRVEQEQSRDFELLLTILTGVPGSGKESLCLALLALAKENSKWIILKRPVSNSDAFDPKVLQESLTATLSSQRRLHARLSASGRRLRVIVVTPGFTDIAEVIQAIRTHPDSEMSKCVKIGAVTCCVDPLNTFMGHRLTLPRLLEQCAQGWVNNVVFTSCVEPQNEQLSFVQKLVRACNPDVAFILAKGGEVTRTPDVELILSDIALDEDRMVQKRELMCPGWSLGLFLTGITEPQINEIGVTFYGPLSRQRFVSNLKGLHGPISSKEIHLTGAIHSLQGHVCFSEGPYKRVHVQWSRLNGVLKMSPVDSSAIPRPPSAKGQQNGTVEEIHDYLIVFTGFSLQEQVLKDWLRTCCKPAPVKQKLKTRQDLSEKEVNNIGAKHKFDPLPPGWFYNGLHYVSLTGEKDSNHPLLETFIDRYLLDINEEITRQNSQTDDHPPVDIFPKP